MDDTLRERMSIRYLHASSRNESRTPAAYVANAPPPPLAKRHIDSKCILSYSIPILIEEQEARMSKTVTLRLDESVYRLFRGVAERENRPISNFIETAVLRFVQDYETADEFEMAELRANTGLNQSLKRGYQDAKHRRGAFV